MIRIKMQNATIGSAIFAIILSFALTFGILAAATWLVCWLWGITFTWKLFAGVAVIYMCLPSYNSGK